MAISRCPYCHAIIDENDKYCNNCGTQLLFPDDESLEEEIPGEKIIDAETEEKDYSLDEPEDPDSPREADGEEGSQTPTSELESLLGDDLGTPEFDAVLGGAAPFGAPGEEEEKTEEVILVEEPARDESPSPSGAEASEREDIPSEAAAAADEGPLPSEDRPTEGEHHSSLGGEAEPETEPGPAAEPAEGEKGTTAVFEADAGPTGETGPASTEEEPTADKSPTSSEPETAADVPPTSFVAEAEPEPPPVEEIEPDLAPDLVEPPADFRAPAGPQTFAATPSAGIPIDEEIARSEPPADEAEAEPAADETPPLSEIVSTEGEHPPWLEEEVEPEALSAEETLPADAGDLSVPDAESARAEESPEEGTGTTAVFEADFEPPGVAGTEPDEVPDLSAPDAETAGPAEPAVFAETPAAGIQVGEESAAAELISDEGQPPSAAWPISDEAPSQSETEPEGDEGSAPLEEEAEPLTFDTHELEGIGNTVDLSGARLDGIIDDMAEKEAEAGPPVPPPPPEKKTGTLPPWADSLRGRPATAGDNGHLQDDSAFVSARDGEPDEDAETDELRPDRMESGEDSGDREHEIFPRRRPSDSGLGYPERLTQSELPFQSARTEEEEEAPEGEAGDEAELEFDARAAAYPAGGEPAPAAAGAPAAEPVARPEPAPEGAARIEGVRAAAEAEEVPLRRPFRLMPFLKARLFDILFIGFVWLVALWLASRSLRAPLIDLVSAASGAAFLLYAVFGGLYFFLFKFFLGETLGDRFFREPD